jgi:SecD/SecF fusion protein
MKYLYILCIAILFSCGNITPKHKYAVIYEFENLDKVAANDRQGTIEVLNKRLDQFASSYEVVLNNKQQIEIELRTDLDLEAVNAIITNPGKLDFWECVNARETPSFFLKLFDLIEAEKDTLRNPLKSSSMPHSAGVMSVDTSDVKRLNVILERKEVVALLPLELKQSKFLFGQPVDGKVDVYVVKLPPNGIAFVNETHIVEAYQKMSSNNRPSIFMEMNENGTQRWERMTAHAYQQGSQIAITLNNVVYSAPTVSSGPILVGKTEITGDFTIEEAQDLALIFSSQKRIPKLKFVNSSAINDKP